MFKRLLLLFALIASTLWSADNTAFAQTPRVTPLSTAVSTYLATIASPDGQAYFATLMQNGTNAWQGAVQVFSNPPASVGPLTNGFGQVNLPTLGTLTPTGSYQQTLYVPSGVPIFGGWNTGIQTTVNTYVDSRGRTVEVAPDPLSAFNYALTRPTTLNYAGVNTGYANPATWLGNWFSGNGTGSGNAAFRIDLGLVAAFNSNFGQGMGDLFGVGVYVYDAPAAPSGQASASAGNPSAPLGSASATVGSVSPTTGSSSSEEVYLKAVIPQPPPQFTLTFQPPYPTVLGQDPTKRGVDVYGHATLGVCTVIWHHVAHDFYYFCGSGVPNCGPNSPNVETRESTREWDTTDYEADMLASATVDSSLSAKSVAYIQGPLQTIYPGAKVQQGSVTVYPSEWAQVVENAPSTWSFLAQRVPYIDPGDWDFRVALTTTGTPHCAPLNWSNTYPAAMTTWLREQRLVK